MLRVISRPITVPAERIALLNAELSMTFSIIPGSVARFAVASPDALAGGGGTASIGGGSDGSAPGAAGGGASRAFSRSYAESRSIVWPYSACSGEAWAAALIASGPMVSISDRGARILVHATGV